MTERQIRELFALWIERLGLAHWSIEISVEAIKPRTTTMRTTKSPHYDRGRITIQPWVITAKPPSDWHPAHDHTFEEVVEQTIVHELLHLLLWETCSVIFMLARFSKKSAHTIALTVQEHEEENFVDRLAVALVKAWPRTKALAA